MGSKIWWEIRIQNVSVLIYLGWDLRLGISNKFPDASAAVVFWVPDFKNLWS